MGCSKNLVDSESIMARFAAAGWKVEFDSVSLDHDLVIINTCGFIHDAKEESVDMILEYASAKSNGRVGKLCITGCLTQRYKKEMEAAIPEADLILGVNPAEELTEIFDLGRAECSKDDRFLSTPSHYAYLKISEGCDRKCSFCTIPQIRGKHVSRPVEEIVREAGMLASRGVRELILIAQDLTYYGYDLYGQTMIVKLLEQLQSVTGIEWIRLHYAFPANFPEALLDLMSKSSVICRYLDIPFQHNSDKVLKNMRRGINKKRTGELIVKIRDKVAGIALRTTLLVGHPGESEEDFQELKEFVRSTKFERLGVFPYSHEEGTHAFAEFKDNIPDAEKNRRVSEIMEIQQEISASVNLARKGKEFRVLIDREDDEYYYGRTEFDSPEVDNEVIIKKTGNIYPGEFCVVRITEVDEFDLYGEIQTKTLPGEALA